MTAARGILPMGERALLVEVATLEDVLALHAALAASLPDGVEELVAAARTVLVRFDPARVTEPVVRGWIADAETGAVPDADGPEVALEVAYDGPDLAETARLFGLTPADLAARHARTPWRVAFTGFAPGFAYLVGEGWAFDVPRLDSPRTRVPAGAVGLAAGFTGAYPRETPGGWRLIGTTSAALFDPDAADPVLLTPGARVRFAPAPRPRILLSPTRSPGQGRRGGGDEPATPSLRVDAVGAASVQDLGRPGLAALGIARSGALDRAALRLGNRLVGNPEDAAGVEIAPGGFAATALGDAWIAITGTWPSLTIIRAGDAAPHPVDAYRAQLLHAGDRIEAGRPSHGARAYLALRGGVAASAVFGSRATDTLAGLGPAPVRAGDELCAGDAMVAAVPVLDAGPWGWSPDQIELRLRPGPRADWFTSAARRALTLTVWTVSTDADRVGVRLDGPELGRSRPGELPSEGMVPGALQVPPAGRPVVLLADGPVTGGYPVIAVVDEGDLDALAQAVPGTRIRFRHSG